MSTNDFLRRYAEDEEYLRESPYNARRMEETETRFANPRTIQPLNPRHPDVYHDPIPKELMALCAMCEVDCYEIDECYIVFDDIWHQTPLEFHLRQLCIGCLEEIIGRKLDSRDFANAPMNYLSSESERLMDRFGEHFRLLEVDFRKIDPFGADAIWEEHRKRDVASDARQRIAQAKIGNYR